MPSHLVVAQATVSGAALRRQQSAPVFPNSASGASDGTAAAPRHHAHSRTVADLPPTYGTFTRPSTLEEPLFRRDTSDQVYLSAADTVNPQPLPSRNTGTLELLERRRRERRIVIWRTNWDYLLRRKTWMIFANAMAGIVLMIALQQACWDSEHSVCVSTPAVVALKWIIFGSTIALLIQLVDRKRLSLVIKQQDAVLHGPRPTNRQLFQQSYGNNMAAHHPASSPIAVPSCSPDHPQEETEHSDATRGISISGEAGEHKTWGPALFSPHPRFVTVAPAGSLNGTPSFLATDAPPSTPLLRGFSLSLSSRETAPHVPSERSAFSFKPGSPSNPTQSMAEHSLTSPLQVEPTDAKGEDKCLPSAPLSKDARATATEALPPVMLPLWAPLSFRRAEIHWRLWVQLLVCAFHPFPYLEIVTDERFSNKLGLLMFLRLFLALRFIRDSSQIWRSRHMLSRNAYLHRLSPHFDSWLAVKTLCYQHPGWFFLGSMTFLITLFGYCIYILERETNPHDFTFDSSVYVAFMAFTTGYATDTFGVLIPQNRATQVASLFCTISGTLLCSFLIGMFCEQILPTRFEQQAVHWLTRNDARKDEADAAAALIQMVWRSYWRCCKLEEKYAVSNPKVYEELYAEEEHRFMDQFVKYSSNFREKSRARKENEELYQSEKTTSMEDVVQREFIKLENQLSTVRREYQQVVTSMSRLEQMLERALTKQPSTPPSTNELQPPPLGGDPAATPATPDRLTRAVLSPLD